MTNHLANANAVLVLTVPLTSNTERLFVTNVLLPLHRTGLEFDGKAQIEALRATHVSQLIKPLGYVPDDLMVQIDQKLGMHLSL